MAIEDSDLRDREIWSNVARTWYNQAADKSPNVGRIQHHLAVLARPNIVQQLFFYSKALVSVVPFVNARDSIMLLFTPLLERESTDDKRYEITEASLVTAFGYLFTRGSLDLHQQQTQVFVSSLDGHIQKEKSKWKVQGPEVAATLVAGILDFGKDDGLVWGMYQDYAERMKAHRILPDSEDVSNLDREWIQSCGTLRKEFWARQDLDTLTRAPLTMPESSSLDSSEAVTVMSLVLFHAAVRINATKIGDRNIVPFMCFVLGFLLSSSYVGHPIIYIESYVPWSSIVRFLNTLGRSGIDDHRIETDQFPVLTNGSGRQLPEDFYARGAIWAQHVFPGDFFRHHLTDEDERCLESASHDTPRNERCLYLGVRLASFARYIRYDATTKLFSATALASDLESRTAPLFTALAQVPQYTLATQPHPGSGTPESNDGANDTQTIGAQTAEGDPDYMLVDNIPGRDR
jgi:hypothetical protein